MLFHQAIDTCVCCRKRFLHVQDNLSCLLCYRMVVSPPLSLIVPIVTTVRLWNLE
jgi:hypothetical protein